VRCCDAVVGVTGPSAQSAASIVGTWKVEKYEDRAADGTFSYPFGEHPGGYFVYDATGHLSVHIMRTPPLKNSPGMREGSGDGDAYREAFLAYAAYFGTYTVDVAKGTVTHHAPLYRAYMRENEGTLWRTIEHESYVEYCG
jgi:hypothetical protein